MIQSILCLLTPVFTRSHIYLSTRLFRRNASRHQKEPLSNDLCQELFADPLVGEDSWPSRTTESLPPPQQIPTLPPPSFPSPPASEASKYHASILVNKKVKTLSNLLAVIRETEKRFGPILEYRCPTNFDSTCLSARIFIRFRDASSIAKISDKSMFGYFVHAPNEFTSPVKPEGEGLADILDLLQANAEIPQGAESASYAPSLGSSSEEVADQPENGLLTDPTDANAAAHPESLFVRIQVANDSQVVQATRARPHEDRARIRYMAMFLSGFQGFSAEPTPTMVNAQKFWTWQTRKLGAKPYPVPLRGAKVDYLPPRVKKKDKDENEEGRGAEVRALETTGVEGRGRGKPILTEPLLTVDSLKSVVPVGQGLDAAELAKESVLRRAALRRALSQAPSFEHFEQKAKEPPKEKEATVEMNDTVGKRKEQLMTILEETMKQGGGLAKVFYSRQQGSIKRSK